MKNNMIFGSEGYTYILWLYQTTIELDGQYQQLNILQLQSNSDSITKFANRKIQDASKVNELYVNKGKYEEIHRQLQECLIGRYRLSLEVGSMYFQGQIYYILVQLLYAFCIVALGIYKAYVEFEIQRKKFRYFEERNTEKYRNIQPLKKQQVFESKDIVDFIVSKDDNISKSCKLEFRP